MTTNNLTSTTERYRKTFHIKHLLCSIYLHWLITPCQPQFNLVYTDWTINQSEIKNDSALQHNCLYITNGFYYDPLLFDGKLTMYCMSELRSELNIKDNDLFPDFTFVQLSEQNITSQ